MRAAVVLEEEEEEEEVSLYIIDLNCLRFPLVVILKSPIFCFVF